MSESDSRALVLSAREKGRILVIYVCIAAATTLGVAGSIAVGSVSFVLGGLGLVAFVFGLRHGVDADHIAAIDNVTRKLIQEGKTPLTVGTWFSLGHSTVVVVMILGLVIATKSIVQAMPFLQVAGALICTTVFCFLLCLDRSRLLDSVVRAVRVTSPTSFDAFEAERAVRSEW